LRAWRMRDRCRTPGSPEPWVAAIARHEGLRAVGRRVPEPIGGAGERAGSTDDPFERALGRIHLERALATLAPVDRALVALRNLEDRSHAEIARLMDMHETTVRVRLHRARAQVRDVI
jgi:RNA polymerase sigma-70 factor (ECF subfamily)